MPFFLLVCLQIFVPFFNLRLRYHVHHLPSIHNCSYLMIGVNIWGPDHYTICFLSSSSPFTALTDTSLLPSLPLYTPRSHPRTNPSRWPCPNAADQILRRPFTSQCPSTRTKPLSLSIQNQSMLHQHRPDAKMSHKNALVMYVVVVHGVCMSRSCFFLLGEKHDEMSWDSVAKGNLLMACLIAFLFPQRVTEKL